MDPKTGHVRFSNGRLLCGFGMAFKNRTLSSGFLTSFDNRTQDLSVFNVSCFWMFGFRVPTVTILIMIRICLTQITSKDDRSLSRRGDQVANVTLGVAGSWETFDFQWAQHHLVAMFNFFCHCLNLVSNKKLYQTKKLGPIAKTL